VLGALNQADVPVGGEWSFAQTLRNLCVPESSPISCGQAVFVDQAVDASLFPDAILGELDGFG
jgi:hypothetical protein